MSHQDLAWTVPVMRAGYAGRGIVYTVVAGFSLYAIWRGGQAQGTTSALAQLETTIWGGAVLVLISLGMVAYAVWRGADAAFDLDDRDHGAGAMVGRATMLLTGLMHLSIAAAAFTLLFTESGGSGGSSMSRAADAVMGWPGGRWIVAVAGLAIMSYGGYYLHKGWNEKYRDHLVANHFTENWNPVLKAGLIAKGIVIAIVGGLAIYAAWTADPAQAGGTGDAFSWLTGQPFGRILVALICVGLLGFAVYCFVSAAYRFVPKVSGRDVKTLGERLEEKAREGARRARDAAE